jgi:hypothetical protein
MTRRKLSRLRKARTVYCMHWIFELSASVTALVMGQRHPSRSGESRACMVGAIPRRVFGGEGETAGTWRSGASAKRQAGLRWRVKAALRSEHCASRLNAGSEVKQSFPLGSRDKSGTEPSGMSSASH